MSEHWQEPEGGLFSVAIPARDFQTKVAELETFFGRRLSTYSHCLTYEHQSYVVIFFKEKADGDLAISTFGGQPFDPRDKGRGKNWMRWMKGRGAGEDRRRSPYKW